jgi:hypothetical protein
MGAAVRDSGRLTRLAGALAATLLLTGLVVGAAESRPARGRDPGEPPSSNTVATATGAPEAGRDALAGVASARPRPQVTTSRLPLAKFGRHYVARLRARLGNPPYRWHKVRGALPAGLRVGPAGVVTGEPRRAGTRSFTARVVDETGRRDTRVVRLRVKVNADVRVSGVSRSALRYSYRPGCPLGPSGLRRITINQWGWHGPYRGELIVRAGVVRDMKRVFRATLRGGFPVRKMRRVDRYHGSDPRSMRADNTSAFNCRHVTGNPTRLSQHSYGNAVDINPRENPYVTSSRVYPPRSGRYLDRSPYRKGMIVRGGAVARKFARLGWWWGARWSNPDYQHFSSNGG